MIKNSEEYIQIYIISFLRKLSLEDDFIALHIPNGGYRSKKEGAKLKLMGVIAGAPDILILKNGITHFIELKKLSGKLSPAQSIFISKANCHGFRTSIIYADDVKSAINDVCLIMTNIFGFDRNRISKNAISFIESIN